MKNLKFSQKTIPWALLIVCLLAFGLLIPWLGFYQDDWYQIWFRRAYGAQIFIDYYAGERPFIALLYMLTTPFVGTTPLAWQIFGLLARWLAALAVWWLLRLVWPRHAHQTAWAALLFALYPGFRIQFASVIYSHYFLQLAIQVGSLGAMLLAFRRPHRFWFWTVLGLLGALFGLFSSEYFFGLELLRPILLWMESGNQNLPATRRIKQVVKRWLPYLGVLVAFLVWRIFIFEFPTYQPFYIQNPGASPLTLIFSLVKTIVGDVIEMGLLAWGVTLRAYSSLGSLRPAALASAGLALASGVAIFVYLLRLESSVSSAANHGGSPGGQESEAKSGVGGGLLPSPAPNFAMPAISVGLFLLLASGWPFWFVDLQVNTDLNGGSRFGISFMLGSALLLAGLIDLLGRKQVLKIGLVAVLAGLAIGFHFMDADFFREVNRTQASFFQQLAWRAPGLQPGTLVLTNSFEEHVLSGDNSLTAALNWIYEPERPYSLAYMLFYIPTRIETGNLTRLEPGVTVEKVFRTATFHGSTDHALVLYYPYPQCLRVLDPQAHQDLPRPVDMPREIKAAIPISNLGQIIPDANPPASLPAALFKVHYDQNTWCYYFEKAELARQQGDWAQIAALADQALPGEQKFSTTWELLPFIEGYARSGRAEKARQLTLLANRLQPDGRAVTKELLCSLWDRLGEQAAEDQALGTLAGEMHADLVCQ